MSERHEWAEEPLGTTAEELARLMDALGDWAKESRVGAGGLAATLTDLAGHAAEAAGHLAESVSSSAEHLDAGAPECTYCPLCRTVHVIRESSPEVKVHLAGAAASLMQAAAAVLHAASGSGGGSGEEAHRDGVEHIDLDEDHPVDPDQ